MYLVWYLVCYLVWYLASVILGLVHCMIHSLAVEETITVSKIAPPPNRYFRKRKIFLGVDWWRVHRWAKKKKTICQTETESGFPAGWAFVWSGHYPRTSMRLTSSGKETGRFSVTSGQSYKHFTLINYDSRVVITSKLLILMTLET